jgi:dTDP-4-dehydrorhamnose 3,5-epimerase
MKFTSLPLQGAFLIEPDVYRDERGHFFRYYCRKEFEQIGHSKEWVQYNHSYTQRRGSIRGMHYQVPPFAEVKMVRCIAGHVIDVIVDLRQGSPTFLHWTGVELSAANRHMVYIPEGFAHGFQTLTDHCELLYHHTEFYKTGAEGGLRFDDPQLQIKWPLVPTIISERDRNHILLNESFQGIKL